MRTLILTGGGTAGHATPALALLPELRKHFDEIVYVGSKNGIEKELATEKGLTYYYVPTVKLERKLTPKNLLIPFKLIFGIRESIKLIKNINPSAVFSKGGYVSLPVVIASKKLGIPVISHESDITVGLANKIVAKNSSIFLTSFDVTKVENTRCICTGSPLSEDLFSTYDEKNIIKKYGLSGRKKILLVFGGSQGSNSINEMVKKTLNRLLERYDVILICGKGKKSNVKKKGFVEIEFCKNIGELFAISDLVVSRAGANSLFELTALKKPTLAIPLPKGNSRGDQIENAKYFQKRKMIEVLEEENMSENSFFSSILKLESKAHELTENCRQRYSISPNEKIAKLIKKVSLEKV